MPSSTSSSDPRRAAADPPKRPVATLGKAGWLALVLFLLVMAAWEAWVRSQDVPTGYYRNSDGLWAEQRRRINRGEGDAWVFTGSSRMLFDTQIEVWAGLDGRQPIQLALEGSSPVTVMEQLADDPDFTGKLLVGVAPGLFFSGYEYRRGAMDRYEDETPTQWLGQKISMLVEPYLAFYNNDFALPVILRRQPMPIRNAPDYEREVRKLMNMERDRNTRLWDKVELDKDYNQLAKDIWAQNWMPFAKLPPHVQEMLLEKRQGQLDRAVAAYEKLAARGVDVVFVQMPYEGHYTEAEPDIAPRADTWDVLLERTGAIGLHFQDQPEMQGYHLPEWSHMTGEEADRFTEAFYHLVQRVLARRENRGDST